MYVATTLLLLFILHNGSNSMNMGTDEAWLWGKSMPFYLGYMTSAKGGLGFNTWENKQTLQNRYWSCHNWNKFFTWKVYNICRVL